MDRILKLQRQKVVLQSLKNQLSMKDLFLTTMRRPPKVIVNIFSVSLSVSFFLLPCSKGQAYLYIYYLNDLTQIRLFVFKKITMKKKALKIWNLQPFTGLDAKTNPYKPFWKLTGKKVEDKLILCKRRCSFWPAKMNIPFKFISRFCSVILIISTTFLMICY